MQSNAKIYVAGHRGLVGSALVANLKARGYAEAKLGRDGVLGAFEAELGRLIDGAR
jgi:nucleoside-diphosphate-sugar epimerase